MPHPLNDFQKAVLVRIAKKMLGMLNSGGHLILSRIVTCDGITHQESRGWIYEDGAKPTMTKQQRLSRKSWI